MNCASCTPTTDTLRVPSPGLVVGFKDHNYGRSLGIENLYKMMQDYVLPAIH